MAKQIDNRVVSEPSDTSHEQIALELEKEMILGVCYSCNYFTHYRAEAGFCPYTAKFMIDMFDTKCSKWELNKERI